MRRWALEMLSNAKKKGASAHTPWDRARILLEAVQDKLWVPDPVGTEFLQGAHLTACTDPNSPCFQGGDCDDLTVLLCAAYLAVGLDTLVVGHAYDDSRQIAHVLAAVHLDNKWHYADPSPIGGNSTDYAPLGKCVPFTRERLYSLPNERMICDENACLVTGRAFNPAGFVEQGHFVGVNGTPQFAYRVQWLPSFLGQAVPPTAVLQQELPAERKQLSNFEKILLAGTVISGVGVAVNVYQMGKKLLENPKDVVRVRIHKSVERSYSSTGYVYRAFRAEDDSPLYLGAETLEGIKQKVRDSVSPRKAQFVK